MTGCRFRRSKESDIWVVAGSLAEKTNLVLPSSSSYLPLLSGRRALDSNGLFLLPSHHRYPLSVVVLIRAAARSVLRSFVASSLRYPLLSFIPPAFVDTPHRRLLTPFIISSSFPSFYPPCLLFALAGIWAVDTSIRPNSGTYTSPSRRSLKSKPI